VIADRELALAPIAIVVVACAATPYREGLNPAQLPAEVRADYRVFARRCSKCHLLSRALQSGIERDSIWEAYVRQMQRQPGSGIAPGEVAPILRFLHYYTSELRRPRRPPDPPPTLSESP
jgi:hypothetical protein